MQKKTLIISGIFLLSGCGDKAIETVKETHLEFDQSQSISQALDHRKICEKTTWESYKDSKDRNIVQYKCEIKNTESFFDSLVPQLANALEKKMKNLPIPEQEAYYKVILEDLKPLNDKIYQYEHQIEQNSNETQDLENIVKHGEYERDIEYAKNEIKKLKLNTEECKTKIQAINLKIKNIESNGLTQKKEAMDAATIAHDKLTAQKTKELIDSYQGVKVNEIYRWAVNDNGAFLVFGGTETIKKNNNSHETYSYSNLLEAIRISYADNTDNYQIYRRTRRDIYFIDDL